MKRVTLIAAAMAVAVVAVLTTSVWAQETNTQEVSYITFSNTVELPGVTLPAGTYTFRLADIPTRNVVQVLDRDQKKVMGQWLFVQAERPEVSGDTVIMFKENAENTTPAVQYWYFPGEKIGKEFVYPKDQASKIAARTGQRVRTDSGYAAPEQASAAPAEPQSQVADNNAGVVPGTTADAISSDAHANADQNAVSADQNASNAPALADQSARQDTDRDVAVTNDNAQNSAVGTSGVDNNNNAPVATSGSSDNSANNQAASAKPARRLPKTGSELPLAGLIGLLSLAGALSTRAVASARR
jgi:hypothetical protein